MQTIAQFRHAIMNYARVVQNKHNAKGRHLLSTLSANDHMITNSFFAHHEHAV